MHKAFFSSKPCLCIKKIKINYLTQKNVVFATLDFWSYLFFKHSKSPREMNSTKVFIYRLMKCIFLVKYFKVCIKRLQNTYYLLLYYSPYSNLDFFSFLGRIVSLTLLSRHNVYFILTIIVFCSKFLYMILAGIYCIFLFTQCLMVFYNTKFSNSAILYKDLCFRKID